LEDSGQPPAAQSAMATPTYQPGRTGRPPSPPGPAERPPGERRRVRNVTTTISLGEATVPQVAVYLSPWTVPSTTDESVVQLVYSCGLWVLMRGAGQITENLWTTVTCRRVPVIISRLSCMIPTLTASLADFSHDSNVKVRVSYNFCVLSDSNWQCYMSCIQWYNTSRYWYQSDNITTKKREYQYPRLVYSIVLKIKYIAN
jgi:hypothetical protein